ncbi:MAG: ABC transporter ATP-binding protein/permease [Actinomycetota bacterium]|nr:ABC transporter ATP-binding protein/permease [Actinomycetota bacterium]
MKYLIASTLLAGVATLCGLAFPLVIQRIIDGPIAHKNISGLWGPAVLLLVFGLGEALLFNARRLIAGRPIVRVEQSMRDALYEKLQALPVSFHDKWPAGQLISRAATDLGVIRRFLAFGGVFLVVNSLTFVVGVVILMTLSVSLGLIVAALAIPLVFLSSFYERRYQVLARRSQDQFGDLTTTVEESVLGIRIIKAFGRSAHLGSRFIDQALDLRTTELSKAKVVSMLWAVIVMLPEVALGISLIFGIRQVASGSMTAGELVAFFGVAMGLSWPIDSIGWLLAVANDTAAATDRFFEVMDSPITIASPAAPQAVSSRAGHLRFSDVGFRFQDTAADTAPVLSGLNLDIAAGETVAVVGATGSGKTTLTALVERLYDVTAGSITLDGVDLRDFELSDLRQRIGIAFEEPTLFSASVRENVLLGLPDGTDADVRLALRVAQAGFVHDLPWGLDTRIGEQGMSLSGGQRQRLALARAVVGRPSVLVLDDPLSALDIHTESQVEAALRSVLGSTTALVIAHRASTVMLADRVALLSGGRITAIGSHSELMARVPEYSYLLASEADSTSAAAEGISR